MTAHATEPAVQDPLHRTRPDGAVVLVVDDDDAIRTVIDRQLKRLGCTPLLARDGAAALRLFDANPEPVDLVLLDWHMPGTSGRETLAALLARRPDLRVILVTGSLDAMTDEHATQDTVSILVKPFKPADLMLAVRTVLGA